MKENYENSVVASEGEAISTALLSLLFFAMTAFVLNPVSAQETQWNTARGNTYQMYSTLKWTPHSDEDRKKLPTTLFVITYLTKTDPKNETALLAEYDDLMTHFYYFYAPQELKK